MMFESRGKMEADIAAVCDQNDVDVCKWIAAAFSGSAMRIYRKLGRQIVDSREIYYNYVRSRVISNERQASGQ